MVGERETVRRRSWPDSHAGLALQSLAEGLVLKTLAKASGTLLAEESDCRLAVLNHCPSP